MSPNYLAKLGHYVAFRFPLLWMLPLASNRFLLPYLVIQLMCLEATLSISTMIVGSVSCLILLLTQRISDDLLDEQEDKLLAAKGIDEFQKRPLVTGAVAAIELIQFRKLLFLLLLVVQLPLIFTQPNIQNLTALLLIPSLCYVYINHISWRISSHVPGSTAIVVTCYAISLISYEAKYFTSHYEYSEMILPIAFSTIVSWLPIVSWQRSKNLAVTSKLEFKKTQRDLHIITILSSLTSVALITLLLKLQLTWVLIPLFMIVNLNIYVYLVSIRKMTLNSWFHKSSMSLSLFQYFVLPITILIKLALV
jgi:hypothetical protein